MSDDNSLLDDLNNPVPPKGAEGSPNATGLEDFKLTPLSEEPTGLDIANRQEEAFRITMKRMDRTERRLQDLEGGVKSVNSNIRNQDYVREAESLAQKAKFLSDPDEKLRTLVINSTEYHHKKDGGSLEDAYRKALIAHNLEDPNFKPATGDKAKSEDPKAKPKPDASGADDSGVPPVRSDAGGGASNEATIKGAKTYDDAASNALNTVLKRHPAGIFD